MSAHGIGALQDCKILPVASDGVVDTAGFEGVIFTTVFAAAADTNKLALADGLEGDGSDQAAITGASLTSDDTVTTLSVELHKPMKRFVSCTVTGTGTMVAMLYAARTKPVTQDATVTMATSFVSPPNLQSNVAAS